jgi:hypothetical protein
MCDEKLETTNEALLKRIEAVEEKLEELKFAKAIAVTEAPTIEKKPLKEEAKPTVNETPVNEAPNPAPEVIAPPVKENAPTPVDIEQKKFRQSAELIEKLEKTGNFMLASFLGLCKFFYSDRKLLIVADSDYTHSLINEHRAEIATAVSPLIGTPLGEGDVYVKKMSGIIEDDPFADLIN